ncbi:MAG: sigma-70 family RNA polymerase sigma factor [Solirubrobacterales bacterium]|nr:sigma-70 family RNA polymerase sigma factor [Solirubrobacterales bacterium]
MLLSNANHTANTRNRGRVRGEHAITSAAARRQERRGELRPDVTTESFQLFLNQATRYPLLTAAEEVELAKAVERGDLAAKERLVNSNLRLVVSIARRYQGLGLPMQDLVQEAMFGLIRAAEKFDWRRGYKFSTYATLWIRQSIQRGLDNTSREIRVPSNVAQQLRALSRVESELTAKLDRSPSEEEVAAGSKFSLEEVQTLHDLSRVTTSLDATISGDSETTLGQLHADAAPAPSDDVEERERERAVITALSRLEPAERQVLEMRFGTSGQGEATLREVGRELGVTQERARQIEAKALESLASEGSLEAWREAA